VDPYERRARRHVDAAYDRFLCTSRACRDGGYADDGRSEFLSRLRSSSDLAVATHALGGDRGVNPRRPGSHREPTGSLGRAGAGDEPFQIIEVIGR
jgi:hypothetical protein